MMRDQYRSGVPFMGMPKGWIGSPLAMSNGARLPIALNRTALPRFSIPKVNKTHFSTSTVFRQQPTNTTAAASAATEAAKTAVRQKPGYLLLIPTFVFTHFTLGWALVPPIYFTLRQTNISNALLAGPQGAWLLSRKVPDWVPDVVIDGLAGPLPPGQEDRHSEMTVEQLVERMARRGLQNGWKYAKYGGKAVQSLRKLASGDQEEITQEAMRKIGGTNADKAKGANEVEARANGIKDRIVGYTKRSARSAADEIDFGQIRDGLAAYILVKILLPIRLPISLFLTPKVARFGMHAFRR
ncbi:uncharacterized protein FA14DRAFT_61806 [Meira miltonrushii]|uniref:Uncharacterized protein n=1 Tax=Meira miltonrushii TaxID=1280837 RepID=A0A316V7G9_9BASI|nr:uncharacterized protein FA14DRAFT_61806 [Meira miltonrushii]PWN33392.1 hypothetical protein FA14DRAFT_61806 [Meira miltonrushii]